MKMRLCLAVMGAVVLADHAVAGTREDVLAAMQRCSVMPDDRTWLDCTYGAQQMMRANWVCRRHRHTSNTWFRLRLRPHRLLSRPVPNQMRLRPRRARRQSSFWQVLGGTAPPVAVSVLASVTYDGRGAFIATLENGQVWRQSDADELPKLHLRVGTRITILPGALSSYNLRAGDNPHNYKVERQS